MRARPSASGGITYLSNSLIFGNTVDALDGTPIGTANLIGVDPLFVDRPGGDYHLGAGSPAIDAGNTSPPGSLGSADLDNRSRTSGAAVDVGAYEVQ